MSSKTKKPRNKRHNPKPVSFSGIVKSISNVMWKGDTRRLSDIQQIQVLSQLRMAWDDSREEYSPGAFNLLGHFYRLCKGVAEGMGMPGFSAICDEARNALQLYYDSEGHEPLPKHLADRIEPMIEGLRLLLPDIPLGVYERAHEVSREVLIEKTLEQFDTLPPEYIDNARAVMAGEKVPAVAERTGLEEKEVSLQARVVAAIVYTVKGKLTDEFPTTIDLIRKQSAALLRSLDTLLESKRIVEEEMSKGKAA